MTDILDKLAQDALNTIKSGYYANQPSTSKPSSASFESALKQGFGLIAEVKPASPSGGNLIGDKQPCDIVDAYAELPITGLSILTDPVNFDGSLDTLRYAASRKRPVLFKDFVLNEVQLDAATTCGASCVLLILALFERGYATISLPEMIQAAERRGLEVLLEVYDEAEYLRALETDARMIGINNRDLKTLDVHIQTTKTILDQHSKDGIVWGLSGVNTAEDVKFLKQCGVDACLVGTALMKSDNPKQLLKSFLAA